MEGIAKRGANAGNRRTAVMLGAVALVFFVAIILKYWLGK
jgi:hypothetical protein